MCTHQTFRITEDTRGRTRACTQLRTEER